LAGLILPPLAGLATLWVGILGFTLGGTFGLSLLFLVHRATGPRSATTLSGMAQSVGYLVAAVGPVAFGLFHDLTGSWLVPLLLLVLALLAKVAAGLGAGCPGKVHEPG
ncbi:MAG TPA: hypothetical protein VK966_02320, partial [Longimicrobiales bacterium]|nr:hypothetical protein [Longimicrobiales bacterium]